MSNGLGGGLSSLIPNKREERKARRVRRSVLGPSGETVAPSVQGYVSQTQQQTRQVVERGDGGERRQDRIYQVEVNLIDPNPMQPRVSFGQSEMEDLVNSIREHGILEPLIATYEGERFQLIAGERRLRAAKILEMKTVPLILRTAEDMERLELSLIENIQRHDLNPIEVAESYAKLLDEFGLTQDELSRKVGKSRSAVANSLRLLTLPSEIQKALGEGKIFEGHARMLLTIEGSAKQMTVFRRILERDLTVVEAGNEVRKMARKKFTRRAGMGDPNILDKENRLQEALGTRVKIKKKGEQGRIEVDFYSEEELNGIVNTITNNITNKHESEDE